MWNRYIGISVYHAQSHTRFHLPKMWQQCTEKLKTLAMSSQVAEGRCALTLAHAVCSVEVGVAKWCRESPFKIKTSLDPLLKTEWSILDNNNQFTSIYKLPKIHEPSTNNTNISLLQIWPTTGLLIDFKSQIYGTEGSRIFTDLNHTKHRLADVDSVHQKNCMNQWSISYSGAKAKYM